MSNPTEMLTSGWPAACFVDGSTLNDVTVIALALGALNARAISATAAITQPARLFVLPISYPLDRFPQRPLVSGAPHSGGDP